MARVYLAQARNSRLKGHASFHATLLRWASRRRMAVYQPTLLGDARGQGKLF
jgi:hypothetical protein